MTPRRVGAPRLQQLTWDLGCAIQEHPVPPTPTPAPSLPAAAPPGGSDKSPHWPGFQTGPIFSSPIPFPSPAHSAGEKTDIRPRRRCLSWLAVSERKACLLTPGQASENAPGGIKGSHRNLGLSATRLRLTANSVGPSSKAEGRPWS